MDIEVKITIVGKEMKLEEARALYYRLKDIFDPVSIPSVRTTPLPNDPGILPPIMTYGSSSRGGTI